MQEKELGPEHPHVTLSLNDLAAVYLNQGKYADAESLYRRSLAIREKALGPEHRHVALSLNKLAELTEPGQIRRGRAPLQTLAGNSGEGARARASPCGQNPE
ncbi:MAG: hypothetical protein DMG08_11350 [Acidobacteria bacterium]|nr:MAG: hypothetical protein DMG08_11350 [Acidobacteriota bacterium]